MSDALTRKKFTEFKERTDAVTDAELDVYLDGLAARSGKRAR